MSRQRQQQQWEVLGRCKDCNALVYVMDGEVRQISNLEDHICEVEKAEEAEKEKGR